MLYSKIFLLTLLMELSVIQFSVAILNAIHPKSADCYDLNPTYIKDTYCYVKPTRDGRGLLTLYTTAHKKIYDIWLHLTLYYKFRVYQKFPIDVEIDVCKLTNSSELDFSPIGMFGRIFMEGLKSYPSSANLVRPCPWFGERGVKNLVVEDMMSALPNIFPAGTYKFIARYHTSYNVTYATVVIVVQVDAYDIMKRVEMGK